MKKIKYSGEKMDTETLIDEVVSLPVEVRTLVVESLLQSLNQPESAIDDIWGQIATKRLAELRSGKIKAVDGKHVFSKIWERLEK